MEGSKLALLHREICYLLPKFQNSVLVEIRESSLPPVRKSRKGTRAGLRAAQMVRRAEFRVDGGHFGGRGSIDQAENSR